MVIERTNNEVIIRLSANVNTDSLQRLIDYLTYKEATLNVKTKQDDVDAFSKEIKAGWWSKNKNRLIK